MSTQVKIASLIDLDKLTGLFDCYRQFYGMPKNSINTRKFLHERIANKESIIFLAKESNSPAGFAQIYPSFSSVAMKKTWILNDLYIDKNYRGIGIGKAIMKNIESKARDFSIFSIKLVTAKDNQVAKNLYDSLDYKLNVIYDSYSKQP